MLVRIRTSKANAIHPHLFAVQIREAREGGTAAPPTVSLRVAARFVKLLVLDIHHSVEETPAGRPKVKDASFHAPTYVGQRSRCCKYDGQNESHRKEITDSSKSNTVGHFHRDCCNASSTCVHLV